MSSGDYLDVVMAFSEVPFRYGKNPEPRDLTSMFLDTHWLEDCIQLLLLISWNRFCSCWNMVNLFKAQIYDFCLWQGKFVKLPFFTDSVKKILYYFLLCRVSETKQSVNEA